MTLLLAFGMPNGAEWLIIAVIGLLLFGKRLPEVGRSLGKGIVEFKKGLNGIEEDMDHTARVPPPAAQAPALPPGAKFDPYTGKPLEENQPAESRTQQ